jgi:hypothetical protein
LGAGKDFLGPLVQNRQSLAPLLSICAEGELMDLLRTCMDAVRVLARSNDANRAVLVERYIDEYLRTETVSLIRSLERLRRVIHYEEAERREGDDWSVAREYVCSLLHRMT